MVPTTVQSTVLKRLFWSRYVLTGNPATENSDRLG